MPRLAGFFAAIFVSTVLWAQPPGNYYNSAQGLNGQALQQALHLIISQNHEPVTYHSLWTHFQTTDAKPNGKVWDIYSDIPGNPPYEHTFSNDQCTDISAPHENYCYNREHSWPRSWYGPAGNEILPMHTDLFHIYPVDAWVNELRSNYPFGKVNAPTTTTLNGSKLGPNATPGYSGIVLEPIDAYKGDLARTCFYMATRYADLIAQWQANSPQAAAILNSTSYPAFKPWYIDLLIAWHEVDPVSQKEIDRNNAVYTIQGNRNPFIDHPEFVNYIWGTGLASEPEHHVADFSAQTITLTWEDATGDVLPNGYLIRMSDQGFQQIADPVNGQVVPDDFWNKNVPYDRQSHTFGGLTTGTVYYFKIFSYKVWESEIVYKTGGDVPQVTIKAR
jgi:endonuclease I